MNKSGDGVRSWKGQTREVLEPPKYRWQVEAENKPQSADPGRIGRRTFLMFLALSFALLSAFVYLLLFLPTKTPLITVAATNYVWPLPPNAWAFEDVRGFATLDGTTVRWKDASPAWQTRESALENLRFQLQDAFSLSKKSGALILYVSMHGAVNEQNVPCLIPPQASPLISNQWIPLDELIAVINDETLPSVDVLLVLDCVDQQVNWHTAMLNNSFAENVEAWIDAHPNSHVNVMCSTAPDQQAWSGPDLGSSIFGREFRLGLAGAADRNETARFAGNGNGDGEVSLVELVDYVSRRVDTWAQRHRGVSQTPQLINKTVRDFRLGWALTPRELNRQLAEAEGRDLVPASLSAQEQNALWQQLDQLRKMEAYHLDPENWLQLERKLLWLDEISRAGEAYADLAAKQIFPDLSQRLQQAVERSRALSDSHNFFAQTQLLQPGNAIATSHGAGDGPLPSLALKELSGELSAVAASDARRRLLDSTAPGSAESLDEISASLGLSLDANIWTELNFQQLLSKYDCFSAWPDRSIIRQALDLRQRSEQLAVLGDVRGHRWRRSFLNEADRLRRKVEDQLFVGASHGTEFPLDAWKRAVENIAGSPASIESRVQAAWSLRDRGLAEVSYLAAWICSPATDMEDLGEWRIEETGVPAAGDIPTGAAVLLGESEPFQREQIAMQELMRLIYGLHDLGTLLTGVQFEGAADLEPLENAATNVLRDLESLQLLVRDHLKRVQRSGPRSPDAPRSIAALLQLPFLTAEDRLALHRQMEEHMRATAQPPAGSNEQNSQSAPAAEQFAGAVVSQMTSGEPAAEGPGINSDFQSYYSQRLRSWEVHPLSALLLLEDDLLNSLSSGTQAPGALLSTAAAPESIDAANARLRRHYLSMLSFNGARLVDWLRSTGVEQQPGEGRGDWSTAGLAEHLARAMLPVCPLRLDSYATTEFRALSLRDMLLWYTQRTLDDFYAEAAAKPWELSENQTFFEQAAQQVLNFVAAATPPSVESRDIQAALEKRLAILGPLSRNTLQASIRVGPPNDDLKQRPVEISLQSAVADPAAAEAAGRGLPPGTATAMVRGPSGVAAGDRTAVDLPVAPTGEQVVVYAPLSEQADGQQLLIVYRGHEMRAPLFVGQGIVVDFEPSRYDWAEVILFGDRQRQPSIVFVLDCSWSMGESIPIEAIGSATQSKLELAKDSVLNMVNRLAARPDARLGVRLFGHRLGWSRPVDETTGMTTGRPQILPQPSYPFTIPDDILPSNDVEAIVPLGRYTTEMVGNLSTHLSAIVPWGQSPLYLAIIESFQDFAADDPSTAKSIVVITDGDNFQFRASGRPGGEGNAATTLADVERAWQSTQIPLYILGVGISGEDAAQTKATLQGLADRTRGSYYDIDNGNELLRALLEQLSTGVYQVASAAGSSNRQLVEVGQARLNNPVELTGIRRGATYQIQFQSLMESFQLQGGESLEMAVRADGQAIVGRPYDRQASRAAPLVRLGENQSMLARVHRPSMQASGVTFPISVQDPDAPFTPRPSQWWIEVTPVSDQQASFSTYVFYDTDYTPRLPVPAVAWHASGWPESATQADVDIWVKYAPTPQLHAIALPELQREAERYATASELVGLPGARVQIQVVPDESVAGGLAIQVTEMHSEQSTGIGSLRILFENGEGGMPKRVVRRFEPANKIAVHTFHFDGPTAAEVFASPQARLVFCTKSAVLAGAWHLEGGQPLRVDITPSSELLPLEANTFER